MDRTPPAAETLSSTARRHILFASADAPEVAQARSGLEDMRPKWEVEFASDAASARAAVGQKLFDAAVVDLLLPGSDGPSFLKELMEQTPETLRIGLTTALERPAVEQVSVAAHQLLSKPCDPNVLKAVLARAFAAQDFVSHDDLRKLVAGITSLPMLPPAYMELMQELESEEPSLERAGQLVAKDMGLSAKILQLVNSAFFGLGRPISHPSEAAMFLGSETLKALALSVQVFSQFNQLKLVEFSVENLWKHSWTTGVLARRLCEFEEAGRAATDEAFISGLLHDVGKLVLAANHPTQLEEAIRQARQNNLALWEQEYRMYGASHAELGGYLLGIWGLPSGVVEAVAFHHRPGQARRQTFCALTAVHAANTVGNVHPSPPNLPHQLIDMNYLRSLGLVERLPGWKQLFTDSLEKRN
ncbi:MAG TPA: response regulator [Candidatus Binatia bacterium]|nr:response regulator [Candidatus Binatia bacterium]